VRIVGLTTAAVDRVRLILPGARAVSAGTQAAPLSSHFRVYTLDFRSQLLPRPAGTLVAYDGLGRVVGRRPL